MKAINSKAKTFQLWINGTHSDYVIHIMPFVLVFIFLTDRWNTDPQRIFVLPEKFKLWPHVTFYIIRQRARKSWEHTQVLFCNHRRYCAAKALRCPLCWRIHFRLKAAVPQSNCAFFILRCCVQRRTGADLPWCIYVKYFHIKSTIWALIVQASC